MTRHKTTVPSTKVVAATATPRDPFALLQEVNDVLPPYQLVQL